MANLYRVQTGSVGLDGKPISDVFSGTEHIKDPADARLAGVDISSLPLGTTPAGFTSQFDPVKLDVSNPVPASALETPITRADLERQFSEFQAKQNKRYEDQIAAMAPTQGELDRQARLTNLQEAQTRSVEDVQQRSLDGAILTGGANAEISNIQQGKTFASLPNIREQRLLTLQLGNDLAQRQIKVDQAKVAIDAGNADYKMFSDYQATIQAFDEKVQERNDKLPVRQKELVDSIVTQYAGLEWGDLDPATQKSLADLAGKLGISVQVLQTNLKNQKNLIGLNNAKAKLENQKAQLDMTKTQAEINKLRADTGDGLGGQSNIDTYAQDLLNGDIIASNVPQDIRGRVIAKKNQLKKEASLEELKTTIQENAQQGDYGTREELITALSTYYKGVLSKDEVAQQVYDLIPDVKNTGGGGFGGFLDSISNYLFGK